MQSVLARRVASGAAVALAAAALSLGAAGTAHADITVTDLHGTVTGGGAPAAGIFVYVEDAATHGDDLSRSTTTDALGHYNFDDLEFAGPVNIEFYEDTSDFTVTSSTFYLDRWYNGLSGSRFEEGAKPVTLAVDGNTNVNMAMTRAAILAGTVTAQDGHALTDGFGLELLNTDDLWDNEIVRRQDATNFRIAAEPGTLRLGAYGWDVNTATTPYLTYVESWWLNADRRSTATPFTVSAGQTVTGFNFRLTNSLTSRQAPQIVGIPAVGRALTATPGTWSKNAGTEFSYTWMRGATVVGTGATYTPTVADFGQKLNVVVRALNFGNAGQAASAQTDTVRYPADAKGKAKALAGHKVRVAAKIVSAKQSPVKGKVVLMRGTKVVHKAVKLVKGKAVIVAKHQPKGKQTYTLVYKGNSLLSKAIKTFTVRVH